jgi:hypothetical protein
MTPAESRIVMPGVTPSVLGSMIVQGPAAGPVPESGPFAASAGDHCAVPARLVNQLESGTSSMVLTFTARAVLLSPGFKKEFSMKSNPSLLLMACTRAASCVSGSRVIGSSSKNFGLAARPESDSANVQASATAGMNWSVRMRVSKPC